MDDELTPLDFVGSSQQDLRGFPEAVRYEIGHALYVAQRGGKHASAKPLKGEAFKGAGVLEVVECFDGDTYRAVYTVRFRGRLYVLHAFQKKSKTGDKTPKHEIDVVRRRLKQAERDYHGISGDG